MNGLRPRVIPCLLVRDRNLYKTRRFKDPVYVGDPLNAIRIFNDKGADELVVLDIGATPARRGPDFALIQEMATECFMPLAYGGGVTRVAEVERLVKLGVEKVVINTAASNDLAIVRDAAREVGSSSVVVSIDVKRGLLGGRHVHAPHARRPVEVGAVEFAKQAEAAGAGELLLTSVDREGSMEGYDVELVRDVAAAVSIPVVASGGAGTLQHFQAALAAGASAVSAGSMFVFHGRHRAVLITYPDEQKLAATVHA